MRWTATVSRLLAIVLAFAAIVAAASARAAEAQGRSDGALLYHNYCSVCHGDKGDGRSRAADALSTPPRDFTSEASRRELTRERIIAAVSHGRPGTAMVAWRSQLSPADIERVADHVLTHFVHPGGDTPPTPTAISGTRAHGGRQADVASTSVPVDMTAGLPNGLKGDLKRGGAFYTANCATCHGLRGDGAGPRAYFINPKPRDFTAEASRRRLNRIALFAAVSEGRNGSEMPAWSRVASAQQIADVSEYVFQAFIQGRTDLGAAPR